MRRVSPALLLPLLASLSQACQRDEATAPRVVQVRPDAQLAATPTSRIAFTSGRDGSAEIYTMDPDGLALSRLTNNTAPDSSPSWSPDGRHIAFASMRDGNSEIYVMNADGSAPTRLTDNPAVDREPSWSPDGQRIAFSSTRDGNSEIYVMNADGSAPTRLTNNSAFDNAPTWSPDGTRIAFRSTRDLPPGIYVMNADGSAPTRLADAGFTGDPSWSPDGLLIAFTGGSAVRVMAADGSGQRTLTNSGFVDGDPTWSPDGRQIAFKSNRDGNVEIYVMNADGSAQTRVTNAAGGDLQPSWSPGNLATSGALTFVTQPPESVDAGAVISPPVQVTVQDSSGNTVPGATDAVTLALGNNPTGATLFGTTTVRAVDGVATFSDLRVERPGSGYTLLAAAAGRARALSNPFAVIGRGALAFVTPPPPSVAGGVVMSPPIQLAVQDAAGNTVPGATNAVTLALGENPSGATLLGTTTVQAVNGIATFDDLVVDRPGSGYTLVATAAGLTSVTSAAFAVHLTFASVDAGIAHSCGVTTDGAAYCWGSNGAGQLGDGFLTSRTSPVLVRGGLRFAAVDAGFLHSCGLTTSGDAYCWGDNESGQLGDGTLLNRASPVRVLGGLAFAVVNAGVSHTCGVTTGRDVYCWGDNQSGQLGDGTVVGRMSPVAVIGGSDFTAVGAGYRHTCGVTTSGTAFCWGRNLEGQLGDGTIVPRPLKLVAVVGVSDLRTVSAGIYHNCGVTTSATAYCWGWNGSGRLGDGTEGDTGKAAAPVTGGLSFSVVSAGQFHSCGVTTSARAYCWGGNHFGEIGDGTSDINRASPVAVAGGLTFARVSAGFESHSCGVTPDGRAYCWGANGFGQLGNGTVVQSLVPVAVVQ